MFCPGHDSSMNQVLLSLFVTSHMHYFALLFFFNNYYMTKMKESILQIAFNVWKLLFINLPSGGIGSQLLVA